jgi:NADPH-dependent 2,4-dienoyl-CoA reductase/sulfur reductase-like enzyme
VPDIRDVTVTNVVPSGDGFRVEFAEEAPAFVRQAIIATGVLPYAHIPSELSGLPADLMTHSSAHDRLDQFRSKRVAVIGAGQSALQTAALLHEAGADVQVIARREQIIWEEQVSPEIGLLDYILRPPTKLCQGWGCACYDSPDAFRLLPESFRVKKALSALGPKGAWWLRDRVEGVLEVLTGHQLRSAKPQGSGVRLHLDGPKRSSIAADHVIAGTGFRIDVSRLPFLPEEIRAGLVTRANCPVVNRAGESTIPGLYFAGAPTMVSLGPGVRFISGTHQVAAHLARSVARRARRGTGLARPAVAGTSARRLAAGTGAAPVG